MMHQFVYRCLGPWQETAEVSMAVTRQKREFRERNKKKKKKQTTTTTTKYLSIMFNTSPAYVLTAFLTPTMLLFIVDVLRLVPK